ncbi:hypothetical protein M413DRAFT_26107 [Hebeloma cylindrosporum]|uniref:Aminoglycoside phosphotransferase domain-containing protein n=1 Tax=Hebeloma cylindrosporum TaxID=76867 RepID=A0A0C2YS02_HEBCY|nr:hypothetical protein M413DRAFT_26107 [Hebeloma cylindrosporum h7]
MTDSKLPFYNILGEIEYLSGYPLSFGDWPSSGKPLSAEQQSLIDETSYILRKSPTEAHVRAEDLNLASFEDDSKVVARKILPKKGTDLGDGIQKLGIEARLLKWLSESTKLPVPRIQSPLDIQDRNIVIMDKLPGTMLLNTYGTLNTLAKARPNILTSYALIALELFELDVPQRIGTFDPDMVSGSFNVTPMISVHFRATKVFEDIRQYLDFLFEMKKASPLIDGDDGGNLDELKRHTDCILADLSSNANAPTLFRCVLVHRDLNDMNILVDKSGSITGVIDWEYQVLHPAVLAACYPPWLSYDGCSDPRFVNPIMTLWLDSPKESKRLRDLYLEFVKSRNHKYWEALVLGAQLRSCVEWLLSNACDPGCRRMKKWMEATFSAS